LDLERDYGTLLEKSRFEGLKYVPQLVDLLKKRRVPTTIFVQGQIFETNPLDIEILSSLDVEFGLHSYSHPPTKEINTIYEVKKSRETFIKFFGTEPYGYRFPNGVFGKNAYDTLAENGLMYDSSVFPSMRPGEFNNLALPVSPYILNDSGIIEFPFTVFSNIVRIPIALSYIKLLGKPYYYLLKKSQLPPLIIFDFHMHDLFYLASYSDIQVECLPYIYRKIYNKIYMCPQINGFDILNNLISIFEKKGYRFAKLIDIYNTIIEG
jgi:peptidoglycan/xylan/chitin deacetylase (PgdA/CDA1 family)